MRLVLALTIVTVSAAGAQAAEDRYGPSRDRSRAASGQGAAAPYNGPMLTWTGKTPAPMAATAASAVPALPQPVAPWAGPVAAVAGQRAAPYPSIAAQAPVADAYAPAPQIEPRPALPTSLYGRPAAAPMAAAPSSPSPRYDPPARPQAAAEAGQRAAPYRSMSAQTPITAAYGPAPQVAPKPALPSSLYDSPAAAPVAAVTPAPSAPKPVRAPGDAGRSKAYSVLREFGGVPDPIDIPPPTSYWATRPETAPVDAVDADLAPGGGVGSDEVADAAGQGEVSDAARRRERDRDRARAAEAKR